MGWVGSEEVAPASSSRLGTGAAAVQAASHTMIAERIMGVGRKVGTVAGWCSDGFWLYDVLVQGIVRGVNDRRGDLGV